jgi:hypothetical protein
MEAEQGENQELQFTIAHRLAPNIASLSNLIWMFIRRHGRAGSAVDISQSKEPELDVARFKEIGSSEWRLRRSGVREPAQRRVRIVWREAGPLPSGSSPAPPRSWRAGQQDWPPKRHNLLSKVSRSIL